MTRRQIEIGAIGNDGTGDSIRDAFRKVNENFRELYSSLGLGDRLSFKGLDDTPASYSGQENSVVTVNNTETGLVFKQLKAGNGVQLDFTSNPNEIAISTLFSSISGDPTPQLGGNLSARSGATQYRILNLGTQTNPLQPIYKHEAVNKAYADTKISLAGVEAVDPATGQMNPDFGTMTGPLILSRDPVDSDDEVYGGMIAATKRYVDGSAFGSIINLYVSTSGQDERTGLNPNLQGRALAYAYRTLEAALKRAEEIILDSRLEIGPYKKVLTYGEGGGECTLSSIIASPDSGTGFIGQVYMSVDTLTLTVPGTNYRVGDIISIAGGTGTAATVEVLATIGNPGAVLSFRPVSSGVYTVLPGNTNVITSSDSEFGGGARFDLTYKVNKIDVIDGGTDYGLVSVRILPAVGDTTGSGAFGTADVLSGAVVSITVDDPGSGFTALPSVTVDLPRFKIFTAGLRTDFTGNVLSPDPTAVRSRDVREGLYLRGETSGALAQILGHTGALDGQDELFDVDIKYGAFEIGEVISYGDVTRTQQISVLIETGVYEENYPLKVPQNVALIGDEFRRVIVRPKPGESSSPWAFQKFRRDLEIDGNVTSEQLFGWHYLADPSQPVYPPINNKGAYRAAASLLGLNKVFLQQEIIAWINNQILNVTPPFDGFDYDSATCSRDVGLIIDAMIFDLKYGGFNRTISAGLKYRGNASGLIAITTQLSQTVGALVHLNTLVSNVISNTEIDPIYNTVRNQIIDQAFIAESGSSDVIDDLFTALIDVISNSGSVNYPKNNDNLDVFLCNDAVIVRALTAQGHGGFTMVLDPEGQILAKSPYAQECATFSKSSGRKRFAGGMFVDGFTGNLQFKLTERVIIDGSPSNIRLRVSNLVRPPNLPASFIVNDAVYRINYVRDYVYNPAGSTAQFVLDEVTPFTLPIGAQTFTVTTGTPGTLSKASHGLEQGATLVFSSTGTLPSPLIAGREYYVIADGFGLNNFRISDSPSSNTGIAITTSGSGTHSYERVYEVLMPGNRSMLANDFTQICDMGYGLVTHNGGLLEAVSVFTYYCYISYYSLNGGQIRSVGGSSAHGNYALVAEGSDPLEIPTPVTLYYDLGQGAKVYFPSSLYANNAGETQIYVYNYTYVPLDKSELEIIHIPIATSIPELTRYSVNSVSTVGLPAGVARLTISSTGNATTSGLAYQVPPDTPVSIRNNSQVILTGDVVDVATRPSTALVLNESDFVYRILQFEDYVDPGANTACTISLGSPATITATDHGLLANYIIEFDTDGTLPSGLNVLTQYYVLETGLTSSTFRVALSPNGTAINTTTSGSGTHSFYNTGLARTTLRENYDYVEVTVYEPNEYAEATKTFTVTVADPAVFTSSSHGFAAGDVVRLSSTGTLPAGLTDARHYHVLSTGLTLNDFTLSPVPNGPAVEVTATGLGTYSVGRVKGRVGDNSFLIVAPGPNDASRLIDYKFAWCGFEYTITNYESESVTGISGVGRITISPALQLDATTGTGSVISLSSAPTLKAGVPKRSSNAAGTLTIRISLTRVTSHDLLEIGTGSYADTNYPNEIYGPAVNPLSEATETEERGSGRVFFVTTDQFGNFKVGPYFKVDQGTGTVTFAAAIALSNLDGIGFKRGVPIAEFSVDATMSDNATDTVPTEYAVRTYLDKRLGKTHAGEVVDVAARIPATTGGFVSVDGTMPMIANLNLDSNRIINVGDPQLPTDAVNLRSLVLGNFQDANIADVRANDIAVFTGDQSSITNSTVVGDISLNMDSTAHTIDAQINAEVINTADISSTAAIDQYKLSLNNTFATSVNSITGAAATRVGSNVTLTFASTTTPVFIAGQKIVVSGFTTTKYNGTFTVISCTATQLIYDITLGSNTYQASLPAWTLPATPAVGTGTIEPLKGLSVFDSNQFTATNGWISVKDNGILVTKIAQIAAKSVLGNNDVSTNNVAAVSFSTVVDQGNAVKKSLYSAVGYLKRSTSGSGAELLDGSYTVIQDSAQLSTNTLVVRDNNGDFAARTLTLQDLKLKLSAEVSSTTTLARVSSGGGGTTRLYGFLGNGGVLIGNSTVSNENVSYYDNNSHVFRTQDSFNPAPISCSTVTATAITTGSDTTAGTITGQWILSSSPGVTTKGNSRLQATYAADLAEFYEGDKEYDVGTVLVFGGEKEVTTSNIKGDSRVAGVVSDNAAYSMYGACPGFKNQIALQGRVPCKVVGKISKGDLLTTSGIPGVAGVAKDPKAGTLIGKALENYDSDHIGTIEVAVGRT